MTRRFVLGLALLGALLVPVGAAQAAGPLVIAGIDVEDGGPGGHGPIANWIQVVQSNSARVTNGGNGILVIGGGKATGDDVTTFWNQVGQGVNQPITYVNGAANIAAANFAGFRQIVIASSAPETPSGGLTQAEEDALATRKTAISSFINNGGGAVAFSQTGLTNAYGYLATVGTFAFTLNLGYDDIVPTADGTAVGITDALDICCWHDTFPRFPTFLRVLARDADNGQAAALGGSAVNIDDVIPSTSSTVIPACSATGRITITVRDNAGGSGPLAIRYRILPSTVYRYRSTVNTGTIGRATIIVPNGRHSIRFFGIDRAGNAERFSHLRSVRVDRVNHCRAAVVRPRFTG